MAKLTTTPIGSRYGSVDALNDNFEAIETAMENTLSRDGTTPNEMESNIDMNGFSILNAGTVQTGSITINGVTFVPTNDGTVNTSALVQYQFTATASQTDFSVSPYEPNIATTLVFVNGINLSTADFSVDGTDVILPALSAGDEVQIYILADAIDSAAIYNLGSYVPIVTYTDDHILTTSDYGSFIEMDKASAITLTINSMTTMSSTSGASFLVCQKGVGQVTIAAGAGVTLTNASTLKTRAQYSVLGVQAVATNVWRVFGDME